MLPRKYVSRVEQATVASSGRPVLNGALARKARNRRASPAGTPGKESTSSVFTHAQGGNTGSTYTRAHQQAHRAVRGTSEVAQAAAQSAIQQRQAAEAGPAGRVSGYEFPLRVEHRTTVHGQERR